MANRNDKVFRDYLNTTVSGFDSDKFDRLFENSSHDDSRFLASIHDLVEFAIHSCFLASSHLSMSLPLLCSVEECSRLQSWQ